MKKTQWQVVGFLAALLAASTALGQSNESRTITDIPFAFTVANLTLPPGRYTVTHLNANAFWIVNPKNQAVISLNDRIGGRAPESSKMVFHRYGNAYFLSEMWVAGSRVGARVVRSRFENELTKKRPKMKIAELQIVQ